MADARPPCVGTAPVCAAANEQATSDRYDGLFGDPTGLEPGMTVWLDR